MDIFKEGDSSKYKDLWKFGEAILTGFWTHKHFNYDRDVRDFKIELSEYEQGVIERSMQAIAIVENNGPKPFWARIGMRMPHDVISDVGFVFSSNEVIHKNTYESVPNLLGIDISKNVITSIPCMEGRIKYLKKYLEGIHTRSNKDFTKSLILFTLLIENTSLFSQFLIINSFNKHKTVLSNLNAVTSIVAKEEMIHGNFGSSLVNVIRDENPEWFDQDMEDKIRRNVLKAYNSEVEVLDWILGEGKLDFLSKETIIEFLKYRFNDSLSKIGYTEQFEVDKELLSKTDFFIRDLESTASVDFFNQKVTDYSIVNKVSEQDWDF
jgi:ribonucleoside-diphosphate reductase beta chain